MNRISGLLSIALAVAGVLAPSLSFADCEGACRGYGYSVVTIECASRAIKPATVAEAQKATYYKEHMRAVNAFLSVIKNRTGSTAAVIESGSAAAEVSEYSEFRVSVKAQTIELKLRRDGYNADATATPADKFEKTIAIDLWHLNAKTLLKLENGDVEIRCEASASSAG